MTIGNDIVTRLRQEWEYGNNAKGCDYEMFSQAADEIERLRADLENVRDLNEHLTQELQSYYDEDEEIKRGRSGE